MPHSRGGGRGRYGIGVLVLALFFAIASAGVARPVPVRETRTFVAYSMKAAQARIEKAVKSREQFRKTQPDLYYLGGITKPSAVVTDTKTDDWILVGERDPRSSVLTLDDWVVALQARFLHPEKDPGVSIDPRVCDVCANSGKGSWCRHESKQDVRFFAGIAGTHFGQVCYESDWLMKKIGFGLTRVPVEDLRTYYDLAIAQQEAGARSFREANRFWFYPIANRVNVIQGDPAAALVIIERFEIGVFTEVLYAEVDGKAIEDLDNFHAYAAEGFARSFTENYERVAQTFDVLDALRGLTRLAGLAQGVTGVTTLDRPTYWLAEYDPAEVAIPDSVEVLRRVSEAVALEVSGGAQLMAIVTRLESGDVTGFCDLVLGSRLGDALSWEFSLDFVGGHIVGIDIAAPAGDVGQTGVLMAHAAFLLQKGELDSAIEAYGKVIDVWADCAPAYNCRGLAHRLNGELRAAIADYRRSIAIDAHYSLPRANLGVALMLDGAYAEAAAVLREATKYGPPLSMAYNNLGILLRREGRLDEALDAYREAVSLSPMDAAPHLNMGMCLLLQGRITDAHGMITKAIVLEPDGFPRAQYWLGVALYEQGKEAASMAAFEEYLRASSRGARHDSALRFDKYDLGTVFSSTFSEEGAVQNQARAYVAQIRDRLNLKD